MKRCRWADPNSELYIAYHDNEWGRPEHDDRKLFEMLTLEGFQAGLSWLTILKKREAFRRAFDNFQPDVIVLRSEKPVGEEQKKKIALFCNVREDCVIENLDLPLLYAVVHVWASAFVSVYIPAWCESLSFLSGLRFPWLSNIGPVVKLLQLLIPG